MVIIMSIIIVIILGNNKSQSRKQTNRHRAYVTYEVVQQSFELIGLFFYPLEYFIIYSFLCLEEDWYLYSVFS